MSILFICFIVGMFIVGIALNAIDTPAIKRRKRVKELEAEIGIERPQDAVPGVSNQEYIDRLEAEIFGVEKDISGLPGYYWEVKINRDGDFAIDLNDPRHKVVGSRRVIQKKTKMERGFLKEAQKTEEELEQGFQHAFKILVGDELEKKRAEEVQKRMLEKYNGKAVETK